MSFKHLQLWVASATVACLFTLPVAAQSKSVTKTGPNGATVTVEKAKDPSTGVVTTTRKGETASGKTASRVRQHDTGSVSGERSTTIEQTGPNGSTATATRANGKATKTVQHANGSTKTVTRSRAN